jgi:hypothetical protein
MYADRVKETTTTTGTGALTLAGASTGYQTFNAAFGVGPAFYYCIEAVDGSGVPTGDWEVGQGALSGSTTLTRDTILASSNANAAVSLAAGTKNVFCSISAYDATRDEYRGRATAKAARQTMA